MYLITGGCGFIGSHLADILLKKGHRVRILDDLSSGSKKYLPKEADFICGSITDEKSVQQAVDGIEGIFHLAALVSVQESIAHRHHSHQINCGGTLKLLEYAKKTPIVFASSSAVYGDSCLPNTETSTCKPLSPYAVDKLSCEYHAQVAWQLFGTPSVACRFFNVYGPRQRDSSPYSGVISRFTRCLIQKEPLTIYGDGNQQRDFIFVRDIARMLYLTMSQLTEGARVYNFCTGRACTINALADLMMKSVPGLQVERNYVPARAGDILISKGDPSKAAKEMHVQAEISLEEGLHRLLMHEMAAHSIVT